MENFDESSDISCLSSHIYLILRPTPWELHQVQYPAPGSLELAAEVADLLMPVAVMDTSWGLDHGAWSVLMHIFPDADIPVVQLSIDETRKAA